MTEGGRGGTGEDWGAVGGLEVMEGRAVVWGTAE